MALSASGYLFFLGLASGMVVLTLTSFRHVSPGWLRGVLTASALFLISQYAIMTLATTADLQGYFQILRQLWFAASLGLVLPSVFAIDQLLRHPAISPRRVFQWCAPFFLVYGVVIIGAHTMPSLDSAIRLTVHPAVPWQLLLSILQGAFGLGYLGLCLLVMRKIPSRTIRPALLGLALAQGYLAYDGLSMLWADVYLRVPLFSQILMLLVLWHAFETSRVTPQS